MFYRFTLRRREIRSSNPAKLPKKRRTGLRAAGDLLVPRK
jgi:hypothetical protein